MWSILLKQADLEVSQPAFASHLPPSLQPREQEELHKEHKEVRWHGKGQDTKWFISTLDAQKGPTEPSVACQNKVLNTSAQTLTENAALQQGRDRKRFLGTAVLTDTTALERTHCTISILTSLLSGEQMKDNKVPAGSDRNTLPWCFLHILLTCNSDELGI